jgi:hypothetical protein
MSAVSSDTEVRVHEATAVLLHTVMEQYRGLLLSRNTKFSTNALAIPAHTTLQINIR